VVALIGRHAGTDFVLKLRSWNTLFADVVSEAFPDTPWVFGVRNPVEVGVSIERRPPTWMRARQSPTNPFLPYARLHGNVDTAETYFASMLAAFYGSVDAIQLERGLLIDYPELPDAVWGRVCPHFRLTLQPEACVRMQAASLLYAKSAFGEVREFVPDAHAKRAAASARLCEAAGAIAEPALQRLRDRFCATAMSAPQ
jgi:hypothetical protein